MATNAFDMHEGMDVYGCQGEKIGKISHIFSGAPLATADNASAADTPSDGPFGGSAGPGSEANVERDTVLEAEANVAGGWTDLGGAESGAAPPVAGFEGAGGASAALPTGGGGTTLTPSDTKYFKVHHGGLLGIGGDSLYVPFRAIEAITPGDCVTLNCTKDEAAALFSQKPADVVEP